MSVAVSYVADKPRKRYMRALPCAEVRIERHADGRWMWGVSYSTSEGGEGYYPLPKWGKFAATRDEAQALGVQELHERLNERHWTGTQVQALREWCAGLMRPRQLDLFA